jgi:sarcosine oxidase, subunit alpha
MNLLHKGVQVTEQPFRLAHGGAIDRSRPLRFRWEGRELTGFEGDTLASALVANGVCLLGRSFKYHRPRGLLGIGAEEPNILVQLGEGARSTPNVRATEALLYDGLAARPVNAWPNVRFDLLSVFSQVARFLPAGFYYKTFMWPDWHLFEGFIRRAAGLGKVAVEADPDRYESRSAHCDVLVIGAGIAGLTAACAAAASGARVIMAEQDFLVGGTARWDGAIVDDMAASDWAEAKLAELRAMPGVRVLLRTAAVGYHDHNSLTLVETTGDEAACAADPTLARSRTWSVRATQVVLATGAIERPLVFGGNDVPGVMLASAVRHYISRYAALPGRRAVLFTNNDDGWKTAFALHAAGAEVAAIVDARGAVPLLLQERATKAKLPVYLGATISATSGGHSLRHATISKADGSSVRINCDLIAMSGGFNPTVHLFSQSGGRLRWDEKLASFVPDEAVQAVRSTGTAMGLFDTAAVLDQAHAAGLSAARNTGYHVATSAAPSAPPAGDSSPLKPLWQVSGPGKAFVDFQNDVTVDDIALSARENFRTVEHLKRYTTIGMAPDQGKTSNVNALAIMGLLTGQAPDTVGHTRYRFPYVPIALGTMAGNARGELYHPRKHLPAHDKHVAAGAVFEDYGAWARPAYYLRSGEAREAAIARETLAVRNHAGLFDGSPLGKIEVKGPDAGKFLDLIYANTMSSLKVGRSRYGIILGENGVVIDDGVASRLGDDHWLAGTSSAGAERIADWMEEWLQCEWLDLDVAVAPVTAQWAVLTLTGPSASEILRTVGTDIEIDAFPHMSFVIGNIGGLAARVFRVSYTGETSYEINVSARSAGALWDLLVEAGSSFGLQPVGIDAWDALRTEKGFLHIGADTDGTTNAIDIGWGHVLKKSNNFVGKRSLLRPNDQRDDRLQFVGLAVDAGQPALPIGAHIVSQNEKAKISEGYVTSSVESLTLGHPVALAMLSNGRARCGQTVKVATTSGICTATVTTPGAYDPQGERLV